MRKLPVIVFEFGPIYFEHPAVTAFFTTNLTKSTNLNTSEFIIPNWLYDIGFTEPVSVKSQPTVNFTCNVKYPNKLNNMVRKVPLPKWFIYFLAKSYFVETKLKPLSAKQIIANRVRRITVKSINNFKEIETTLLIRNKPFFTLPKSEKIILKDQYRSNIKKCLYTIIIRGDGNGFFQLYEVMSAGRIPVIIDTNMALPSPATIKWEEFALFVPFAKLNQLEEYIMAFHKQHTKEELLHKCMLSRKAFEELLPHNFVVNSVLPALRSIS